MQYYGRKLEITAQKYFSFFVVFVLALSLGSLKSFASLPSHQEWASWQQEDKKSSLSFLLDLLQSGETKEWAFEILRNQQASEDEKRQALAVLWQHFGLEKAYGDLYYDAHESLILKQSNSCEADDSHFTLQSSPQEVENSCLGVCHIRQIWCCFFCCPQNVSLSKKTK